VTRHRLLPILVAAALLSGGLCERTSWAASEPVEQPALADSTATPSDGAAGDSTAPVLSAEGPAAGDTNARASRVAARDSAASAPPADRVVVAYFHRNARCDNCLKFEAYADQALRDSFPEELADGTLEWRVVNLDDTTSAYLVEDYDLFEISLIVSRVHGGQEVYWRTLDAIWTLVGDKDAFMEYVAFEVGEELGKLSELQPQDPDAAPVPRELAPDRDGGGAHTTPRG